MTTFIEKTAAELAKTMVVNRELQKAAEDPMAAPAEKPGAGVNSPAVEEVFPSVAALPDQTRKEDELAGKLQQHGYTLKSHDAVGKRFGVGLGIAPGTGVIPFPFWGGGQASLNPKHGLGISAGYTNLAGVLPVPVVRAEVGGPKGGVGAMAGPGIGITARQGPREEGATPWRRNFPRGLAEVIYDKLHGRSGAEALGRTARSMHDRRVAREVPAAPVAEKAAFGMADIQGMGGQAMDWLKDPSHEWAAGGLAGAGIGGLAGAASSFGRPPEERHTMNSMLSGAVGGGALGAGAGLMHQGLTQSNPQSEANQQKLDVLNQASEAKEPGLQQHPWLNSAILGNHTGARTVLGAGGASVPNSLHRGVVAKLKELKETGSDAAKKLGDPAAKAQQTALDTRLSGIEQTLGGTGSYETASPIKPGPTAEELASAKSITEAKAISDARNARIAKIEPLQDMRVPEQMKTMWKARPQFLGGEAEPAGVAANELRGLFYDGMMTRGGLGRVAAGGVGAAAAPWLLDQWFKNHGTY